MNLRRLSAVLFTFLTKFSSILTKFLSILQNITKLLTVVLLILSLKIKKGLLNCSIRVFGLAFTLYFSKFRLFFVKNGTKLAFLATCFKFAGSRNLKTAARFLKKLKKELVVLQLALGDFWNYNFAI